MSRYPWRSARSTTTCGTMGKHDTGTMCCTHTHTHTHLTASTEKVGNLRDPNIVGHVWSPSGCRAPVNTDVLSFPEQGNQLIFPKDFLQGMHIHKRVMDFFPPPNSTCRFLVINSFFCSGVRESGSGDKDAFLPALATAILLRGAGYK